MAGVFYRHDSICLNKFVKKTYWGKFNFFISNRNLSSLEILISVRLFCKLHYGFFPLHMRNLALLELVFVLSSN